MALTKVTGSVIESNITVGILSVTSLNSAGIITASSFSGNATSATYATNAGISTNVIGGIGSLSQLQVTGISTFTNGPLLIGSGTSTGTASQLLQVTGGAYISGNIGIGTTNPGQPLDVSGNISLNGALYLYNTSRQGLGIWYNPGIGTANQLTARLGGQDRLTIDSSGNLGLGATPSAWNSTWKTVTVNTAYFGGFTPSNGLAIGNNNYVQPAGGYLYVNTGSATQYQQTGAGDHFWRIAPSGTAGSAVTFTQVMTLDSSGNLQLGTTTNPDSRRFRVYGISEFDGNGVSLTVYKSSGTKVGSSGQGDYIVSGGPSSGFGIQSESALVFGTGGTTERARIDTSGNVGIATANPTRKLQVIGDAEFSDVYYTTSYPSIRPSIDLNFAQTKVLDPRINFYRNSFGTYTDDRGIIRTVPDNVPRFDHNPATGESLGLLLEESRTNLRTDSENFSVWGSGGDRITISNNTIAAPDGNLTADSFIEQANTKTWRWIEWGQSCTSGNAYTVSCFVKPGTGTFGVIYFFPDNSVFNNTTTTFNLSGNGSVAVLGASTTATITPYPNGWYRISATQTAAASSTGYFAIGFAYSSNLTVSPAGSTSNTLGYVWGAQLEVGSFATSYIPTSGSTVTRADDSVSIANPAFSFPCSIYGEYDTQVLQYARRLYEIIPTGATGNQSIRPLIQNSGDFDFFASYTSNHGVTGPAIVNTGFKFCQVIRTSGYNTVSLNGGAVTNSSTTTTLTSTSASSLVLGNSSFGDSPRTWCGHIKRFMIYSNTLTNTQIQNLTL